MPDDKQLIKEILDGSQAAMEVLIRRYYKSIYAFVYRKVGDKPTALDLTQEIFIKIVQRIQSYSHKAEFKSWIYTIAINHCRDYWRSADYRHTSQQMNLLDSMESEQKSIPYIFERKETREQIKAAINSLPHYQKEALVLKYYHHLKIKEIAEVTNSNVPTVKSRLKQGLGKLAEMLEGGGKNEQASEKRR